MKAEMNYENNKTKWRKISQHIKLKRDDFKDTLVEQQNQVKKGKKSTIEDDMFDENDSDVEDRLLASTSAQGMIKLKVNHLNLASHFNQRAATLATHPNDLNGTVYSPRGISHLNSINQKESIFKATESAQKTINDWIPLPKKREDMQKRQLFFY